MAAYPLPSVAAGEPDQVDKAVERVRTHLRRYAREQKFGELKVTVKNGRPGMIHLSESEDLEK